MTLKQMSLPTPWAILQWTYKDSIILGSLSFPFLVYVLRGSCQSTISIKSLANPRYLSQQNLISYLQNWYWGTHSISERQTILIKFNITTLTNDQVLVRNCILLLVTEPQWQLLKQICCLFYHMKKLESSWSRLGGRAPYIHQRWDNAHLFAQGNKMAAGMQPSCLYSKQEKEGEGTRKGESLLPAESFPYSFPGSSNQ